MDYGQKKYTAAERSKVIALFIRAAAQIIDSDGVDQVSIRKVATLAEYNSDTLNSESLYFHTWEVFCKYAFSMPQVFDHLFFSPHNFDLDTTIGSFYEVFPNFLEGMGNSVLNMVKHCNLFAQPLSTPQLQDVLLCRKTRGREERTD